MRALGTWLLINNIWRQLGGESAYARDVMRHMAEGDLPQTILVSQDAEASLLAAVRQSAESATQANQLASSAATVGRSCTRWSPRWKRSAPARARSATSSA